MNMDMGEFARFLRSAREQSKVSIQDFAHSCGISTVQNVGRVELGKVVAPSFDTMERILTAINQLDVIKDNTFCFDGYSENLINTLNRYRNDDEKIDANKPIVNDLLEDLANASKQDTEIAFAIIALLKEYPAFRDELHTLCEKVDENCHRPETIDYADIINNLTKRENTEFYFGLNEKIRRFVKTKSYTHAYEFLAMIVKALNGSIERYSDIDDPELSHNERQARGYRRRKSIEDNAVPSL